MGLRFLSIQDVIFATSLSRPTIYRLVKAKEFPEPFPLTNNRVAWEQQDVVRWMMSKRFRERPKYGTIKSETGKDVEEVFKEGYAAFGERLPMHLAPYRKNRLRNIWVDGWKQAEIDMFGEGLR